LAFFAPLAVHVLLLNSEITRPSDLDDAISDEIYTCGFQIEDRKGTREGQHGRKDNRKGAKAQRVEGCLSERLADQVAHRQKIARGRDRVTIVRER
jgi:hypothetical protein